MQVLQETEQFGSILLEYASLSSLWPRPWFLVEHLFWNLSIPNCTLADCLDSFSLKSCSWSSTNFSCTRCIIHYNLYQMQNTDLRKAQVEHLSTSRGCRHVVWKIVDSYKLCGRLFNTYKSGFWDYKLEALIRTVCVINQEALIKS